jgi:STIP1 family protein 1
MGAVPGSVADTIKAEGNTLFAKGKYKAAIDKYTEAITVAPGVAVLYVNRALCHKKLSAWEGVVKDARAALQLQSDLLKAHYVLGVALSQQGNHLQGISHLQKALEAAREQEDKIKDEIWKELARAKLQQYQADSAARKQQAARLQQQLQQQLGRSMADADRGAWEQLFSRAAHQDTPGEVPSMFVCPLTMEVRGGPGAGGGGPWGTQAAGVAEAGRRGDQVGHWAGACSGSLLQEVYALGKECGLQGVACLLRAVVCMVLPQAYLKPPMRWTSSACCALPHLPAVSPCLACSHGGPPPAHTHTHTHTHRCSVTLCSPLVATPTSAPP